MSQAGSSSHSSTLERWKANKKMIHILPHSRAAVTQPIPVPILLSRSHLRGYSRSVHQQRIDYPYARPDHGQSTISIQSEATLVDDVEGRSFPPSLVGHGIDTEVNVARPTAAHLRR